MIFVAKMQSQEGTRLWGDLITTFPHLLGDPCEKAARLLPVVHDGRMRFNGQQVK